MNFVTIGDCTIPTVLARTEAEQERGLMFVRGTPPVMTFVFAEPDERFFWMKNTYVPLDIIFCHKGLVTGVVQGRPESEELVGPGGMSDTVVEMPAGMARKMNIRSGLPVRVILDH